MRVRGFTLIELIIVIVIIGIMSVGFTSMFTQSIQQYMDANRRSDLSSTARLSLERVSRELRDALPNSVRVNLAGTCVEYRPIVGGQLYLNIPMGTAASTFEAVAFTLPSGTWSAAIMPLTTAEVYDTSASTSKTVVGISSVSAPSANVVTVTLSTANSFPRTSPARRFFITGSPVSFCISGQELRRYSGYSLSATQPSPGGGLSGGQLLAKNVQTTGPSFRYSAGTLERNALLKMALTLDIAGERVHHEHEALIRNAP